MELQTFFRGTRVRYSRVASLTAPLVNTNDEGDDGKDDHEDLMEEDHSAITPPSTPRVPAPPGTAHGPSPADFNLRTLTYFHPSIIITSLTLPGAEDPQSAECYWKMRVVLRDLRRRWLMCGLLAISAQHSAAPAEETITKRINRERGLELSSESSAGLGQTTGYDLGLEAAETEKEAEKTGEQLMC